MRILYLIHQFYPEYKTGTEKFVFSLSSMMQKAGHYVKVLTYSFYDNELYSDAIGNLLLKEYTYKGIPVIAIKQKFDVPTIVEDFNELANLILNDSYDLVHVGHSMRLMPLLRLIMKKGVPYIITCTDSWLICPKIVLVNSGGEICIGPTGGSVCLEGCPEIFNKTIKDRLSLAKDVITNSKHAIFPSKFLASIFEKEYPGINTKVIPHGIKCSNMLENNQTYSKESIFTFGYAGTLTHHKGVHIVLDAFKKLQSKKVKLEVYGDCYGNISYLNNLKKLAKNDRRIEFKGVYDENSVGKIFKGIDVLIIPSLCYESYSYVLHEALACKVLVVVSNLGGLAEKISDGVNGYTFEVGDSNSLCNKLTLILDSPEEVNRIKKSMNWHMPSLIEEEAYIYERLYESCKAN